MCIDQVNLYKTGGGPPTLSDVTDVDVRIVDSFQSQFFPMTNNYDDDAEFQPTLLTNGVWIYRQYLFVLSASQDLFLCVLLYKVCIKAGWNK